MYALAINGSPRKGGNTEHLLKRVIAPLDKAGWDTEMVRVGAMGIRGCIACYECFKNKDASCAVKDDPLNKYLEKIYRADALIFGSPTHFASVSGDLKGLMDRAGLVALANGGLLRGKIGAAVAAVRRGGGVNVFDTINHVFQMSEMITPGSTYWNIGYGLHHGEVESDE
ncbi:MAG: flavodoxin family protein, partial [Desulfovibrionaceae bacterium]